MFQFCKQNEIDYLAMRVYIGIWLGIISLLISFFEGSVFIKMFTRFTEDIFAALISLLYIVESVFKLFDVSCLLLLDSVDTLIFIGQEMKII